MIRGSLFQRLTFAYSDGWRSLDKERYLGPVVLTPPRRVQQGDMWGDGNVLIQHATVPRGLCSKVATAALLHTLSGSHCRHEHDCCGCTFRMVDVKRIGKRRYVVRTRIVINH